MSSFVNRILKIEKGKDLQHKNLQKKQKYGIWRFNPYWLASRKITKCYLIEPYLVVVTFMATNTFDNCIFSIASIFNNVLGLIFLKVIFHLCFGWTIRVKTVQNSMPTFPPKQTVVN